MHAFFKFADLLNPKLQSVSTRRLEGKWPSFFVNNLQNMVDLWSSFVLLMDVLDFALF